MPAHVPNYIHDVFVSYAQVDNEPLVGADKGWVSTLINSLKILLGKKLGRADAFSLWMDYELRGNHSVTPDIIKQLEGSATLILILSPGYIESPWCHFEFNTFLSQVDSNSGRIFVVEHDVVERPEPLKDLLGYQFWVSNDTDNPRTLAIPKPHPEEFEYYQRLDDLARQLTDKLKELKKQAKPVTTPVPKNNIVATPRIFLATVTEDLEERRTEIIRYFDQQGIQFLPKKTYSIDKFQQTLDQDLNECRLFVQLLSEQFPPFFNYPLLQYQRALAANCPILQWRAPNLNISAVSNVEHQNLLEASTVIATGFNEFQTIILKHLKSEEEVKFETDDNLVFINATQEDMALAHKIKDFLDAHGIGYSLPLDISVSTTPAEIRQNLEQNLLYCDAVIVVYDKTSIAWVNEQLLYCRRMQRRRDYPLKVIAVYNTPVINKPPLNIKLPNMQILDCSSINTCLSCFLQSLSI